MDHALSQCKEHLADMIQDRQDLLQLIDIMAEAPVGIKSILQSYLHQMGTVTGNVQVSFGVGSNGETLSLAERVSLALDTKRKNEKAVATVLFASTHENQNGGVEAKPTGEKIENTAAGKSTLQPLDAANGSALHVQSNPTNYIYSRSGGTGSKLIRVADLDNVSVNSDISQRSDLIGDGVRPYSAGAPYAINTSAIPADQQQQSLGNSYYNNITMRGSNSLQRIRAESAPAPRRNVAAADDLDPTTEVIEKQYDLARKFFHHQRQQLKTSNQLTSNNLSLQELGTSMAQKSAIATDKRLTALSSQFAGRFKLTNFDVLGFCILPWKTVYSWLFNINSRVLWRWNC